MRWLEKLWYQKNSFKLYHWPLFLFSGLYRIIIFLRSLLYRFKLKSVTHFPVPVIVVGNITAGGTGKTPVVLWLYEWLKAEGYNPGIVSRGYKAKSDQFPQIVNAKSVACEVGDEALMLHLRTKCPVVVDPNRVRAIDTLLSKFNCNVVISDDGLQHTAMGRDIEINVVDGARRFGNQYSLPMGPLREPISRLKTVDFIICQGEPEPHEYKMELIATRFISLTDPKKTIEVDTLKTQSLHAVAAIGNPQRFFNQLKAQGLIISPHAFADHYAFSQDDFGYLSPDDLVIMTEKDAVKCKEFADDRFYYLEVRAQISQKFITDFFAKLAACLKAE